MADHWAEAVKYINSIDEDRFSGMTFGDITKEVAEKYPDISPYDVLTMLNYDLGMQYDPEDDETVPLSEQQYEDIVFFIYEHAALNTTYGQYYVSFDDVGRNLHMPAAVISQRADIITEKMMKLFNDELLKPVEFDSESFDVLLGTNYCRWIDYEDPVNAEFTPGAEKLDELEGLRERYGLSDSQLVQVQPLLFSEMDYSELLSPLNKSGREMFYIRREIENHYQNKDMGLELYTAVKKGDYDAALRAIKIGADVNYVYRPEMYGYTPLHMAAYFAQDRLAELLINSGCKINPVSADGKTPLALAEERHGKRSTVELLKYHGAKDYLVPLPDGAPIGEIFLTERDIYLLVLEDGSFKPYRKSQFADALNFRVRLENLGHEVDLRHGEYADVQMYLTFPSPHWVQEPQTVQMDKEELKLLFPDKEPDVPVHNGEQQEPKSIFMLRMNGEELCFENTSGLEAEELCRAYGKCEKPFVEMAQYGKQIDIVDYAEISQGKKLTFSVCFDEDKDGITICKINGGKGGIADRDRTDGNVSYTEYDLAGYKDAEKREQNQGMQNTGGEEASAVSARPRRHGR